VDLLRESSNVPHAFPRDFKEKEEGGSVVAALLSHLMLLYREQATKCKTCLKWPVSGHINKWLLNPVWDFRYLSARCKK